ncbi:tripartite motif-containing protein 2-like [Mizuhopecten yessoensis]|uniref:Tripartite motif-containing protein 2 n=1 Tax=Mizuhopecten yessoensis TaxID=6573 RepID=A0A210PXU6_MIZYE|nr:tripartite motif-containing protein 2-like [Mizuhopecten yessoensis]OWF41307.1 Tripartite motif-containing protein 2 [Mizuhopecten yessoensis]
MASVRVAREIQDSFLTCAICFQTFVKPKALPCLHTFCEGCLRDYIVSRYESTGQFPCPVCRQVIYTPYNGVVDFPDNHFIKSLRDTVEVDGELKHFAESTEVTEDDFSVNVPSSVKEPLLGASSHHMSHGKKRQAEFVKKFGSFGMEAEQFVQISGMALSPLTDDILVADCSLNKILVYSLKGDYRGGFVCDCSIRDISVTRSGSVLVSVSRAGSAILREYGFDGRLMASYGSYHKYENPFGVKVARTGKVLITSLQFNTLNVFTDRKRPSIKFGSRGKGPNHFLLPYYVTVNSRDDIIISDSGNHRIKVHKNDGTILHCFGTQGSKDGELFYPMGVCTDTNENIYVADANNFRVQMFSQKGEYLSTPIANTYELGVDVKPINVLYVRDKLFVSFRGTKFAEVHVYHWDVSGYKAPVKKKKNSVFASCCCCVQDEKPSYDDSYGSSWA